MLMLAYPVLMFLVGTAAWLYLGTRYAPPRDATSVLGDIGPQRR
jgi:hypothetical protein